MPATWDDWDEQNQDVITVDDFTCPSCKKSIVKPTGNSTSPILLVMDRPSAEDEIDGYAFSDAQTTGILRQEMSVVGMDMLACRQMTFWIHAPNSEQSCYLASLERFMKESRDRKAVLFIGTETIKTLTGHSVTNVAGLQLEMTHCSAPLIMAMPHPSTLFKGTVGETRLTLKKFVRAYKEL